MPLQCKLNGVGRGDGLSVGVKDHRGVPSYSKMELGQEWLHREEVMSLAETKSTDKVEILNEVTA